MTTMLPCADDRGDRITRSAIPPLKHSSRAHFPSLPHLPWHVQALRLTMVQVLINSKGLNMNPLQSLYYVSPACMMSLLIPFCESRLEQP